MKSAHLFPSDVAFTPAVKDVQRRKGSRSAYARVEQGSGWRTQIDDTLTAFIARQTSFFLATASADGQPYIQHRGGPPGFLRVLDPQTLAFADFRGNRQYISVGNLSENRRIHVFLIDYAARMRIKIWGEAQVIDDDPALLASLTPAEYPAQAEQAFVIRVTAWDANCRQHIPPYVTPQDAAAALAERDARIAELEAQLRTVRTSQPAASGSGE